MRGQPAPPNAERKKPSTVSAAIDNDLFEWMEDWRWTNRYTKTEVVVEAMTEWASKRGYSSKPSPSNEADKPVATTVGES